MARISSVHWLALLVAGAAAQGEVHIGEETMVEAAAAGEAELEHEYETLYVLFGFVLVGAAVMHLMKIPLLRSVPSTVIFFVLGITISAVVESGLLDGVPWFMHSYGRWVRVDPHLLLFTFLPPLLFSDAFTIDTHIAMRTFGQCLMLAGPGVVIGSFGSAAFFHYVLPYGWDPATSLMVGSILSATDPVAVVSLLKELGASPVLTMQIQGESMLNDGTAMVLFTIAYKLVSREECGSTCILAYLAKSTLGAWAMGTALGFLFFAWIRGVGDKLWHPSSLVQILLTIACAYWSYLLADGLCGISGVLSTVAAAGVLAHYMWPAVVHRQAMEDFWHVLETVGNILVFFIAGMLTGKSLPHHAFTDFLWAVVCWAMLVILRLATLLLLMPLLNRAGRERVSARDVLVMTWGGLRGMVGLALAILVLEDRAGGALSEEDGHRCFFLVSMVAALTLVVNATTAPWLCSALGITQTVERRRTLVRGVAKRAEEHVAAVLDTMVAQGELPQSCSVGGVRDAVDGMTRRVRVSVLGEGSSFADMYARHHPAASVLRRVSSATVGKDTLTRFVSRPCANPDIEALWGRFEERKARALSSPNPIASFQFGSQLDNIRRLLTTHAIDPAQLRIVREVFLEVLRASYWEQLQQGRFVGTQEPQLLLDSAAVARDRCGECLADWPLVERSVHMRWSSDELLAHCRDAPGLRGWWSRLQVKCELARQRRALQVITGFLRAHSRAQEKIAAFFGQDATVDTAEEAYVIVESQTEVFAATACLGRLAPAVHKYMSTAMQSYSVCERYCDFVHSAHARGVLQGKEAEMLLAPAREAMQELVGDYRRMGNKLLSSKRHLTSEVDAAITIQRAFRRSRVLSHCCLLAQASSGSLALSDSTTLLPCARRQPPAMVRSGSAVSDSTTLLPRARRQAPAAAEGGGKPGGEAQKPKEKAVVELGRMGEEQV